jgi:hypothetical protein
MCPACIGSTLLLLTGAGSGSGLAAVILAKAVWRQRAGEGAPPGPQTNSTADTSHGDTPDRGA